MAQTINMRTKEARGPMRMSHFAALVLVMCALAPVTSAQGTSTGSASSPSTGPNLEETISFMNNSVTLENSFVTSVNHCEVTILRNRLYTFALPESTYLKSTDNYGVPHYGFKWAIISETAQFIRFNFKTIDPISIKSTPVPSTSFIKERDVDEHPDQLKHPDLTVVNFSTANLEQSIELGHLPKDADVGSTGVLPIFDQQRDAEFLVFESQDRAERFVTAFVHAVNLCGGQGSEFPPTPSEP